MNIDPRTGLVKAPKFHNFRTYKREGRYYLQLNKLWIFPETYVQLDKNFTKEDLVTASGRVLRGYEADKFRKAHGKKEEAKQIVVCADEYPNSLPELSPGFRWTLDKQSSDDFILRISTNKGRKVASNWVQLEDVVEIFGSIKKAAKVFPDVFKEFEPFVYKTRLGYITRTMLREYNIYTDSYGVRGVYIKDKYKSKVVLRDKSWYEVVTRSESQSIYYTEFENAEQLDDLIEKRINENIEELKAKAERKKLLGNYPPKTVKD